MKRPIHKHPVFWIVTAFVAAFVDLIQLGAGAVWLAIRVSGMPPPTHTMSYHVNPRDWRSPPYDSSLLDDAPPQVAILPAKADRPPSVSSWGTWQSDKAMGVGMTVEFIVRCAYGWQRTSRMVMPRPRPEGRYDFIANLPSGALEALQREIENKFGLVAAREIQQHDVLLLKVHHPDAPGLKPRTTATATRQAQPGMSRFQTITNLASYVEAVMNIPVVDETGLTGYYDIQLPTLRPTPGRAFDPTEQMKQTLLEQLGLELVPSNAPVEMLVVKKVN